MSMTYLGYIFINYQKCWSFIRFEWKCELLFINFDKIIYKFDSIFKHYLSNHIRKTLQSANIFTSIEIQENSLWKIFNHINDKLLFVFALDLVNWYHPRRHFWVVQKPFKRCRCLPKVIQLFKYHFMNYSNFLLSTCVHHHVVPYSIIFLSAKKVLPFFSHWYPNCD